MDNPEFTNLLADAKFDLSPPPPVQETYDLEALGATINPNITIGTATGEFLSGGGTDDILMAFEGDDRVDASPGDDTDHRRRRQ